MVLLVASASQLAAVYFWLVVLHALPRAKICIETPKLVLSINKGETMTETDTTAPAGATLRTADEMELRRQEMCDRIYPPRKMGWQWNEDDTLHRPTFQGWATSVSKLTAPRGECQKSGCDAAATRFAVINVWGTICEVSVCAPCFARVDGIWCDGI